MTDWRSPYSSEDYYTSEREEVRRENRAEDIRRFTPAPAGADAIQGADVDDPLRSIERAELNDLRRAVRQLNQDLTLAVDRITELENQVRSLGGQP